MATRMARPITGFIVRAVCLACVLYGSSAAIAQTQDESDFIYARKAFGDGFYDLAQERLEVLLKNYPLTPHLYDAHLLLGKAYYYRGNLKAALYEFETILGAPQASDVHDEALYWTGEICLKNGDYKRALGLYEQVTASFPASKYAGYALYSKGWAYYRLGLYEEALACFTDIVARYPYEKLAVESQFRIGECHYLMAQYAPAGAALQKFVETYPVSDKTADAYYMLGEAAFYQARYPEAIAAFERALTIMPKAKWSPFAFYRIAGSLFQLGEYEKSAAAFTRCLEDPGNEFLRAASLVGLIQVRTKEGNIDEALRLADEVIREHPSSDGAPEAYYRKARLLYDAGRYPEAEAACKEGLEKFPRSDFLDEMHYELGWIYCLAGKTGDGITEFSWLEKNSNDINLSASAICKIGDIYFGKNDYEKALERYDVVLDKYPDSFWTDYAQYQVGTIFALTGRQSQAIMAYQSVLANFPNSPWRDKTVFGLGTAYFKVGDFERSGAEFRRLIDETADGALRTRARLYLANSLYSMKKYDDAIVVLDEVDHEAADADVRMMARYQMGWCYYGMHKDAEALALFGAFLKDFPASPIAADVRFWFAEYYRSKKEFDRARGYYEEILSGHSVDRTGEEALYHIALTYAEEGKPGQATERFEELARRFPDSAAAKNAYRKVAKIRKDAKDFDGAIAYLQRSLTKENDELNAQIQYEIAECYELKGDTASAVAEYLKVPYLYPKGTFWSVRARLKCAQLLERLEKFDEARTLYEKLADMDIEESRFARQRLEWLRWRSEKK